MAWADQAPAAAGESGGPRRSASRARVAGCRRSETARARGTETQRRPGCMHSARRRFSTAASAWLFAALFVAAAQHVTPVAAAGLLVAGSGALARAPRSEPLQLFMSPADDAADAYGLLTAQITPLVRSSGGGPADDVRLPPLDSGNSTEGAYLFGLVPTHGQEGSVSVYAMRVDAGSGAQTVVRYRSSDLKAWAPAEVALTLPATVDGAAASWIPKSIAVDEETGRHVMMIFDGGHKGYAFTSDSGLGFAPSTRFGEPAFIDHDDSNLIHQPGADGGAFVDLQVTFQRWAKKYPDNACMPQALPDCVNARRVLSVRLSRDGGCSFSEDTGLRTPDERDPPDAEYYRFRPFVLGDSGRLAAVVLLYATSPWNVNGNMSQPHFCLPDDPHVCHGPFIMNEFWTGPPSGNVSDLAAWSRPFRSPAPQSAAPPETALMLQPVTTATKHIWLDPTGVYTMPLYRLAGLTSVSNTEFSSAPFPMPDETSRRLWLNADSRWGKERSLGGGCGQACAGYVMVELRDAQTGAVLRRKEDCTFQDADGLQLPLTWASPGDAEPVEAGRSVALRFYLRAAVVYAFGTSPLHQPDPAIARF